jgi:hypothetical protein
MFFEPSVEYVNVDVDADRNSRKERKEAPFIQHSRITQLPF